MTIKDAIHEANINKINKELSNNCIAHIDITVNGIESIGEPMVILADRVVEFQTSSRRKVFKGHSWCFMGIDGEEFEVMVNRPLIVVNDFVLYDQIVLELQDNYI